MNQGNEESDDKHVWSGPELAAVFNRRPPPLCSLSLSPPEEVIRVPRGAMVTLTAPTGGGKTSFAIQIACHHALHNGPVVYVSRELTAEEVAARIVGQRCGVTWEAALLREIPEGEGDKVLRGLGRLRVLEHDDATIAKLEAVIAELRNLHADEPILVVIDYLQIMAREVRGDERAQVAGIVEQVRRVTKRLGFVTLALSQGSRSASRGLASGERIGSDTTDAGAETSQIERAAHATLALGSMSDEDDGTKRLDLSIGKNRMGRGDMVIGVNFDGATGLFKIVGEVQRASAVRGKRRTAALTEQIAETLASSPGLSRDDLVSRLGKRRQSVFDAVRTELEAGRLVEHDGKLSVPSSHS